jgi:hypothetical protein
MLFKDNRYDIDWRKLAVWNTPFKWRKPDYMALQDSFNTPVNSLHSQFLYYRNYINYQLSITPQVVYLEKMLNDRYDVVLRRIVIEKGVAFEGVPLYMADELKPEKLYRKSEGIPLVLYTKDETLLFAVDFIVKVPISVDFDINELTAYLDIDVLPSKTYKIQIV